MSGAVIWTIVHLALMEIRRNLLRSILTTLGVVIGVASIIAVLALGNGATQSIKDQISALGSGVMLIQPRQPQQGGRSSTNKVFQTFTESDVEAIREQLVGIRAVAGIFQVNGEAVSSTQSWPTALRGTTNEFFVARQWLLASGRLFYDSEEISGKAVCILGNTVVEKLFPALEPIGENVRIGTISCTVIGTLPGRGQGGFGEDQDDVIIMPIKAMQRRLGGSRDVRSMLVAVDSDYDNATVQRALIGLLRERRGLGPDEADDFTILDSKQISDAITDTTRILTALVAGIASVSLIVGGIGIMNIMLVSVTERTREIGTRLAIGALEREVLIQFLVEAVVLSCFGGTIGIAIGILAALVISWFGNFPVIFDMQVAILAFLFSALVGIIFGYFPARRAAALNPIDALRHE